MFFINSYRIYYIHTIPTYYYIRDALFTSSFAQARRALPRIGGVVYTYNYTKYNHSKQTNPSNGRTRFSIFHERHNIQFR